MYKIGEYQLLDVEEKTGKGFMLKDAAASQGVLLSNDEVLGQIDVGDSIMVFLYHDSKNEIVATMKESLALVGQFAYLKATNITEFGTFFDMGLQRDLFVPLKELNYEVQKNNKYLLYCYLDKSGRLCGTTRVYDHLTTDHTFRANDMVKAIVVRINPEVGVFVAVENKYQGMIPMNEYFEDFSEGDAVELRVIRVREDKKLDLATRHLVKDQMVVDAERIYFELIKAGGRLAFSDKSDPAQIKSKFNMSKKAFKRAVGRLLKEEKIELFETYMVKKDESQ